MYYYLVLAFFGFLFWLYSPRIYKWKEKTGLTYFIATLPSFFIGFCILACAMVGMAIAFVFNEIYDFFKKSIYPDGR